MTIVNGTINSNGVMAINTLNNNLNEIKEKVEQLENVNSERRTFNYTISHIIGMEQNELIYQN